MAKDRMPVDYLVRPFYKLTNNQAAIGVILFLAAVAAMIVANSGLAHWYHELWEKELVFSFDERSISMNLHHLINDGLMAIFFFLVGLEIKREFIAGELSTPRKAMLPIGAAIGGMVVPAAIFLAFNSGAASQGWGIPMATDIAFALGLISVVGRRIAPSVKVFITSLAVVDDIGAVLVIAFFYTSNLQIDELYFAGGAILLMMIANRIGVRSVLFYALVGIGGIWLAFFYSGIHPTIAGILAAFTIPAEYRISKEQFTNKLKTLYRNLLKSDTINKPLNTKKEDELLSSIRSAGDAARSPLQKLEHGLHDFVYFIIMPIFAFANAGLTITGNFMELLTGSVGLGIIGGLLIGKFLGIGLFSRGLVALGLADLPRGATWRQVYGSSILAGIGFTMSLFISELAYDDPELQNQAKSAILVASVLAGTIGMLVIRFTNKIIEPNEIPSKTSKESAATP